MNKILVVDDDEAILFGIEAALRDRGVDVSMAQSGTAAIDGVRKQGFDAVLLDLGLPDMPGLDVLEKIIAVDPFSPVIVFTGRDDAATAVRAMQIGATNYLTKPIPRSDLLHALEQAATRAALARRLDAETRDRRQKLQAIGQCPAWVAVNEAVLSVAPFARTSILVTGESGTGKEVVAAMIHQASERSEGPLVSVNCACFAANLLESELFGHEAGAFTGAKGVKRGLFELASGGTLFLDEVGELPMDLQPKLLRVLETQTFRRLGGEREIRVDVRVVSATNRSLEKEVEEHRFRRDLYHRLRIVEIQLPALRDRGDDIDLLAFHFISRLGAELGRPIRVIEPEVMEAFRRYRWPGNVRELRNVIERGIVLAKNGRFSLGELPRELRTQGTEEPVGTFDSSEDAVAAPPRDEPRMLDDIVRDHVLRTYERAGGNLTQAARWLGIGRAALRRRLREYGVKSASDDADG